MTTGGLGKLLNMAPRTVVKWCDSGVLPYVRMPESKDRRLRVSDTIRFLKKYGYYKEASYLLNYVKPSVMLVEILGSMEIAITEAMLPYAVSVRVYQNAIKAATDVRRYVPAALVIGGSVGLRTIEVLSQEARTVAEEYGIVLTTAVLCDEVDEGEYKELLQFRTPFAMQLLVEAMSKSLTLRGPNDELLL